MDPKTQRAGAPGYASYRQLVVAIAGAIRSGKTCLSIGLSNALGWPRVGFGDYVRSVARSRGLDETREVLQELGATLVGQGWEQFCRAVLHQADWRPGECLVVDGVRHVEAIPTLRREVAPSDLALIFIAVDDSTREARLRQEGLLDRERLKKTEAHSTEAQVRTALPQLADLVVDGSRPERELLEDILLWVQRRTAER